MTTMRERYRVQVRDEIKQSALHQIAELGPQGLSLNAIAKELGVSGPALYRYFAGRDDLLTELVIDAYDDLADAVREAARRSLRRVASERVRAFARAYRDWALANPHRYRLLFAAPVPGYDAHAERLTDAAQAAMTPLLEIVALLPEDAGLPRPNRRLARELGAWARRRGATARAPVALRAVIVWSRLHGLVSLELGGNYASMGIDPDALFEAELSGLAG